MLPQKIKISNDEILISREKLVFSEYIDFLTRSDLGLQYPKENFENRVNKLLKNTQISLVARNKENLIIGICFGITDYAYWLLITDLGIDKAYLNNGIARKLVETSRELAGGSDDIIVMVYSNDRAIPFYKNIGFKESNDLLLLDNVKWTPFKI